MMNYYRAMDRTNISFDFVSGNEPDKQLMEEIKKCGSNYFRLTDRKTKTLRYVAQLSKLIRKNKYDIVHVHGNSATMTFDLLGAVIGGARVRICHVHSTSNEHSKLHAILKPVNDYTYFLEDYNGNKYAYAASFGEDDIPEDSKLKNILVDNNVVYHYVKHGVTTTEKYRAKFLQESLDLEEGIVESLKKATVFDKVTEQYWNKRITMYSLCISNLFRYDAPYEAKYEIDGVIESFAKDPYIGKKIYWKYFERRMILPYILLKIKAKFLLSAIYSRKEKIRQKKLSL